MPKSICILSYSNIATDARILRQIKYLSKDFHLNVIGHGKPHPDYPVGDSLRWYEVPAKKRSILGKFDSLMRIIRYAAGWVDRPAVLKTAIECKADAYLANNWDILPVAAEAARINHALLVLDIHESLYTLEGFPFNYLNRLVVKKYAGQIDACTTVVSAIADDYRRVFNLYPTLLLNAPPPSSKPIMASKTDPQKIRLVHHGLAIPARHSEVMVQTMAYTDPQYELHLIFANQASPYIAKLKQLSRQVAPGKIFFHPPFSPLEIVDGITKFDVGFFPLPSDIYNYKITLPNKFFEFICAGLAVCIGPSPSMAEIINQYKCGIISNSFQPKDIAQSLNRVTAEQWDEMRAASRQAARVLNADIEMQKLVDIFKDLFAKRSW